MPLTSALGYSTFISAKKILSDSGLFIFKPDKSIQDGRETASWMVKNLHGSRMKEFWEKANSASPKSDAEKQESNAEILEKDAGSEEIGALYKASILAQSQLEQGFQETSRTTQEQLTNSSFEFVSCVFDTLTQNLQVEETAHAPLGDASPQTVQGVSEKEEDSPTATDCTSLALVDTVQNESALLIGEGQYCGVEAIFPHEDACSAAPIAQNEFSLNSAMPAAGVAIANQTPGLVEQGYSATLLVENSVLGVGVKADHESQSSAASVPNPEKWSHEAIVVRSNLRPERMQKLKVAANSGQNPGLEYLHECWNDDPALQIVIKKLLAKFPQWGIACVDGVLADWIGEEVGS
jgi:hypothetical protein